MTLAIRAVTDGDLPALFAYLGEQLTENGRNGNPLFQPMAPTNDPQVPPAMKARFTKGSFMPPFCITLALLSAAPYKPGVCQGKPCAMTFPISLAFTTY